MDVKTRITLLLLITFISGATSQSLAQEETSALSDFFEQERIIISGRYRYQFSDQSGLPKDAHESSLRTRFGYQSPKFYGLRFRLEGQDVSRIGNDNYNDGFNGKEGYPTIFDPSDTELFQSWLEVSSIPRHHIKGGRFTLELDNSRFIGLEDWRQLGQSFDGITVTNEMQHHVRMLFGWIGGVRRVFEDEPALRESSSNIHLFNIHYYGMKEIQWTGYGYWIGLNDREDLSSATFGIRAHDGYTLTEDLGLFTDNEIAHQQDYQDNPQDYNALYWRISGGVRYADFKFYGSHESLGSDDGQAAVTTPLASRHNWNGFADKFLITPYTGLEDSSVGIIYTLPESENIELLAAYHHYRSNEDNINFGNEYNFRLRLPLSENFTISAKYAYYDAHDFDSDTHLFALSVFTQLSGDNTKTRPILRKGRSRRKKIYPLGLNYDHEPAPFLIP